MGQFWRCLRNASQPLHRAKFNEIDTLGIFENSLTALESTIKPYLETYKDSMQTLHQELLTEQKKLAELIQARDEIPLKLPYGEETKGIDAYETAQKEATQQATKVAWLRLEILSFVLYNCEYFEGEGSAKTSQEA